MPLTVLLTGFGPFPGAPVNPTGPLVRALAGRRRPAFDDVVRIARVLDTRYAAVDRRLPKLIARHEPDVVLMFGLAARTPHIRIETRARNRISALFPDAAGRIGRRGVIAPDGPAALAARAPVARLAVAARAGNRPAKLSRDAGRYLCNYSYWQALAGTAGTKRPPLVVFVHVPALRRAAVPLSRRRRRRMTADDLRAAGEAILLTLVVAARQRR